MAALPQEVFTLRHEVKDELRTLRQEMESKLEGFRQEMEAFGKDLRQELQTAINTGFNRLLPRQGNTEMMLLLTAPALLFGFLAPFGR